MNTKTTGLLAVAGFFYLVSAACVVVGSAGGLIAVSVVCAIVALGFVTTWLVATKD